jgi:GNAT superfamily N-acetyltransferase
MPYTITPASPIDLVAIPTLDPLHRAADPAANYTVLRVDGELAAFAELKPDFFGYPFVQLLIVGEAYRRRGMGYALLEYLYENCDVDRLFTSTNESNVPMRKLLEKAGFARCGYCDALDEGDVEIFYVRRK